MRGKNLEQSVEWYLKFKKIPFFRIKNYRCFKCGQVQNTAMIGFPDFLIFDIINPDRGFNLIAVECKTGSGRLTKEQKYYKEIFERCRIKYMVLRDTVDDLLKYFGDK